MIETARTILSYCEKQPPLIQRHLYSAVGATFAGKPALVGDQDFAPLVTIQSLTECPDMIAFFRCQAAIGVIDFYFSPPVSEGSWADIPAEIREQVQPLNLLALQEPLLQRQTAQARSEWVALRQGSLAFSALRELQANSTTAWLSGLIMS